MTKASMAYAFIRRNQIIHYIYKQAPTPAKPYLSHRTSHHTLIKQAYISSIRFLWHKDAIGVSRGSLLCFAIITCFIRTLLRQEGNDTQGFWACYGCSAGVENE